MNFLCKGSKFCHRAFFNDCMSDKAANNQQTCHLLLHFRASFKFHIDRKEDNVLVRDTPIFITSLSKDLFIKATYSM